MNDSDQRADSGMGDSTAMTIEFLRARLLSERSVSKTARQRADELAKRVFELEEQLRIVSLQRMKAEKATEAVLAILEGNGISDVSETYDLSSDQDEPTQDSNVRKNESGSDVDYSPVPGRLSWKGCKETSHSLERYKQSSFRRRSNFATGSSSSKSLPGKSCRKIRYKESRSVSEDFKANPVKVDSLEEEIVPNIENSPDFCGDLGRRGSNVGNGEKAILRNKQNEKCFGYGGDRDIEEALENQAQLICQYAEMEKAQREWEEKFRENNNSTPDSCDPGNRSDVTEETYENKASVKRETDARSEVADVSKIPYNDAVGSEEREGSSMPISGSSTQDFVFPMANAMQKEQNNPNKYQSSHNSIVSRIVPSLSSNPNDSSAKEQTFINHSEDNTVVPQRGSEGLGGVLDALKDAKRSLQQRIDKLPIGQLDRARDEFQMPVGCVGLFRLPTDFSSAGHVQAEFPISTAKYDFDAVRRLDSRPYIENGSIQDLFLRNGSREAGLPSSSKLIYPNYPINRTYPDLMPRIEALSSISKMDDKIRPNMYG